MSLNPVVRARNRGRRREDFFSGRSLVKLEAPGADLFRNPALPRGSVRSRFGRLPGAPEYTHASRMVEPVTIEFNGLTASLRQLGVSSSAAEIHGLLCGLLCARGHVSIEEWIQAVREEGALAAETTGHEKILRPAARLEMGFTAVPENSPLIGLYWETVRRLGGDEYDFQLVLPDDEQSLAVRADALADWCQGFIYGLGIGGMTDVDLLSDEVREVVHDLTEISQAAYEDDEELESDECAYMEVVEYARAGVMLVFEELEADRDTQPSPDNHTVH